MYPIFLVVLERNQETEDVQQVDYFCERLEGFICHVLNIFTFTCDAIVSLDGVEDNLIEQIVAIATYMKDLLDVLVLYTLPYLRNRKESLDVSVGDQSVVLVEPNQILYLRELNFTWSSIGQIFGVSRSSLYRLRKEFGLLNLPKYSESCICDEDLWDAVALIKREMPDIGEKMLNGALQSRNIIVPRRRVREALHKVDPINTALRWSTRIKRRRYSVPGPNSLWHLGIDIRDHHHVPINLCMGSIGAHTYGVVP